MLPIGLLSIYVNLFIEGMFGATFGGRPMAPYMLFLALFVVADGVRRLNTRYLNLAVAGTDEPSADGFILPIEASPTRHPANLPRLIPETNGPRWPGRDSGL